MTELNIDTIFELPRPEYAKQAEIIAVDMLWRSLGMLPDGKRVLRELPDAAITAGAACRRMVLRRKGAGRTSGLVVQTGEWAAGMEHAGVFADEQTRDVLVAALLNSTQTPTSSQERSVTCSPVHTGLFPYQTVHGAVNKASPADLSQVVDMVARLGGAPEGLAGGLLAQSLCSNSSTSGHWIDGAFDALGQCAWGRIVAALPEDVAIAGLSEWPRSPAIPSAERQSSVLERTPFGWFWLNWQRLLDPANGWREALPDRRFVDWAVTLLRSGLAMAYIWEAEFLNRLRALTLTDRSHSLDAFGRLREMINSPTFVRAQPRATPIRNKDLSRWLADHLASPFVFRDRVKSAAAEVGSVNLDADPEEVWNALRPLAEAFAEAEDIADFPSEDPEVPRDPVAATNTTREFVRYLLQARKASDAGFDEADLYYLTRSSGTKFWVEPGPEWLVVVSSLVAGKPGGETTLRSLRHSLATLGLAVDRGTLVSLLEEAGLTQDSPDADDGLIISAGFGGR